MNVSKLTSGLLGLALTAAMAQADGPTISCKMDGTNLVVTYTGELYQSTDAVTWTKVNTTSNPYRVAMGDKKMFFCVKGEAVDRSFSIPLANGVNLDMIWIEPGTFIMSSPEDELGGVNDPPQHQVTLTQGYWMGKFEVTQAQYEAVTGENPSYFKGADLPVEQVTWEDAMAFCARLTAQEKTASRLPAGYEYTLPTEAQWEYACRAGTTTALNSGKDLTAQYECTEMDEVGWYKYNSDGTTHPVGQKLVNAWGLYDMHGNVWEWCFDWSGTVSALPVTDPKGPETGWCRIVRGGSLSYYAEECRSAYRQSRFPDYRYRCYGFRVALSCVQ